MLSTLKSKHMDAKSRKAGKRLQVIKIGGNVIDDPAELEKFLWDFSKIKGLKILVHGGGKFASEMAKKLGISQAMLNGRRVTDAETLKVTTMVYAGLLNKTIVASLQAKGVTTLGLSGADLNMIKADKRVTGDIDYGFVGDIAEGGVNTEMISALMDTGITLVFCSVTHDGKGQLLNTNADTIASALAVALSKNYEVQLNYCFEKKGVLKNVDDENSLIKKISKLGYKVLVEGGIVSKGMIPKLDNAFLAIDKGVKSVVIGHSNELINMGNGNAGTTLIE